METRTSAKKVKLPDPSKAIPIPNSTSSGKKSDDFTPYFLEMYIGSPRSEPKMGDIFFEQMQSSTTKSSKTGFFNGDKCSHTKKMTADENASNKTINLIK